VSDPLPHLLRTPSGLAILEIQGTIHGPFLSHTVESSGATDASVGRLEFPLYDENTADGKWMKKVYLYVGKHQRLTGEVKKLAKPYGIIRKVDESCERAEQESQDTLEIVDIVKYKLLFSGRPEPVGEQS
jgi:chromosome transmission fidelity protein 8